MDDADVMGGSERIGYLHRDLNSFTQLIGPRTRRWRSVSPSISSLAM